MIELTLPMETRVTIDKDGLAVGGEGPLLYTLPVEGQRIQLDQWGSFGRVVTTESKWNYALVLDEANPSSSFTLKELQVPEGAHVWESPRVALEVEAVRVPQWKFSTEIAKLLGSDSDGVLEPPFPARPIRVSGPKENDTDGALRLHHPAHDPVARGGLQKLRETNQDLRTEQAIPIRSVYE